MGDPSEELINPEGDPGRIAYARVSTAERDPRLQIDALAAHGCRRLFVERVSGCLSFDRF